jgi:hypothetical protein
MSKWQNLGHLKGLPGLAFVNEAADDYRPSRFLVGSALSTMLSELNSVKAVKRGTGPQAILCDQPGDQLGGALVLLERDVGTGNALAYRSAPGRRQASQIGEVLCIRSRSIPPATRAVHNENFDMCA